MSSATCKSCSPSERSANPPASFVASGPGGCRRLRPWLGEVGSAAVHANFGVVGGSLRAESVLAVAPTGLRARAGG